MTATMKARAFISDFERTRAISLRAEALTHGAQTTLATDEPLPESAIAIARREYALGLMPLRLRRHHPNGTSTLVDLPPPPPPPRARGRPRQRARPAGVDGLTRDAFVGATDEQRARLRYTDVGKFSVTRRGEKEALRAVLSGIEGIGTKHILDGTACIGSDTSLFADLAARVTAVELDSENHRALVHNMGVLGLDKGKVTVIKGNVATVMKTVADADVVYFDPPWGGPGYARKERVGPFAIGDIDVRDLVEKVPARVRHVVLKLPHNYDMATLRDPAVYEARLTGAEHAAAMANPHGAELHCNLDRTRACGGGDCGVRDYHRFVYARNAPGAGVRDEAATRLPPPGSYEPRGLVQTVAAIPGSAAYTDRGRRTATVAHVGQLKLFLSTLQFLTAHAGAGGGETHVVYPGSAHGFNILLLGELFPACVWHLVDPGKFAPGLYQDKDRFRIEDSRSASGGLFTDESARRYKAALEGKHVLFISDIRLNNTEAQIHRDMQMQQEWVKILRPAAAQLKFRIPFDRQSYPYLDGTNFVQMFAGPSSTETRLVVRRPEGDEPYPTREYALKDHEDRMYYFNRRVRPADHGAASPEDVLRTPHTDGGHDSLLMGRTLNEYLRRYPDNAVAKTRGELAERVFARIPRIKARMQAHMRRVRAGLAAPGAPVAMPYAEVETGLQSSRLLFRLKTDVLEPTRGKMRFVVFERVRRATGTA